MGPEYERDKKRLFLALAVFGISMLLLPTVTALYGNILGTFPPDIHAIFGILAVALLPIALIATVTYAVVLLRFVRKWRQ